MRFLLIFLLCFSVSVAHAQTNVLHNGDFSQGLREWRIFDKDDAGNILYQYDKAGSFGTRGDTSVVDVEGQPFKKALHTIANVRPGDDPFVFGLQYPLPISLKESEPVTMKVWLRSPESVKTSIMMEATEAPHDRSFTQEFTLTPQWQEYEIRGTSRQNFVPRESQLCFWLGYQSGTIDIADVRVLVSLHPELDLQFGHGGGVTCVAYSPDGKIIATGGKDGTVKLWSAASGQLIRTIRVRDNSAGVLSLVFSPNGKTIATGCQDPKVDLWNVQSGAIEKAFTNVHGWESAVAFSPDGRLITCLDVSDDLKNEYIYLRDVQTGEVRYTLSNAGGAQAIKFSPDGNSLVAGSGDGKVRIWNIKTQELKYTLANPEESVWDIGVSPDGKIIASASQSSYTHTVRLWDAQNGKLLRAIAHENPVGRVAFSPDGKTVVTAGDGIKSWDVQTGGLLRAWADGKHGIGKIAFSPDGQVLAAGSEDTTTDLWDVQTGKQQKVLGFSAVVRSAVVSPGGGTLANNQGDDSVFLWNLHTGQLQKTLTARHVNALVFLDNGGRIATGSQYDGVQVWDVASGNMLKRWDETPRPVHALALSPDGKILATGGDDGVIHLRDSSDGSLLRNFDLGSPVFGLAFSPDGSKLACGTQSQQAKVLDSQSGAVLHTFEGYNWIVSSLCFSPNGKLLAAGCWDSSVKMWDLVTGQQIWTNQDNHGRNMPLKFSADGARLICGTAGRVVVFDAQTGAEIRSLISGGGVIKTLCLSPDERTIITGGEDCIKIWDNASGRILASIVALPSQVSIADAKPLTADAKALTADAKALTADARPLTAEAREVATSGDYLVVTSDGYYSGSATVDRYIQFKLADDSFPAECFQSRYYRPDLVKLALSGAAVPSAGDFKGAYPPLAAFADRSTVTGNSATVTIATSDDSTVQKVAFLVNGARVEGKETATQSRPLTADAKALTADARPLTADAKVVPSAHTMTRTFTATLPIPADAENVKVQAIAFDEDGLQSPRAEMTLDHTKIATTTGKLLGLCVGVSRYQDARLNLKYADADATALAGDFNKQTTLYRPTQVKALVNEQATAPAVTAALDSLIGQVTSVDTVIVSLSGHGWRDESGKFYFATTEVNRNDVAHSALSWDEVVGRLTRLSQKSKRVIVLLDACHSGSAATNEEMVKAILGANAGVLVFASSRGSEVSLENAEWAHGAFTKALLEAAQGLAATGDDKNLTTIDFIAYVSRRVKTLTENQQHPQVPFLQDFDTDAPIVAKP